MKNFSFDTTAQFDLTRHLAQKLLDKMRERKAIAIRHGDKGAESAQDVNLVLSALVSAVQPTISMIYDVHEQCFRDMAESPITNSILKAHAKRSHLQSEAEAAAQFVQSLTAMSLSAAVRKILTSVHPDLSSTAASQTIHLLAADSILERISSASGYSPATFPKVNLFLRAGGSDRYYRTPAGTFLLQRPGENIDEVSAEDVPGWDRMMSYTPTTSDLDAVSEFLAMERVSVKGGFILADDGSRYPATPENFRKFAAEPGKQFSVEARYVKRIFCAVEEVSGEGFTIKTLPTDEVKSVSVAELASLPTPADPNVPFAFLPLYIDLTGELQTMLAAELEPIFTFAGDTSRVEGIVARFVRPQASDAKPAAST